jgi:hypothetical protein
VVVAQAAVMGGQLASSVAAHSTTEAGRAAA